jgi:hypothetical protein
VSPTRRAAGAPPDPDRETILRMPVYESDAARLAAAFGNLGMPEKLER